MGTSELAPRCGCPPRTATQPPARRLQPLAICPQPFSRQWALFAGGQLEEASVKLRAAELFPAGATVPAVKPRLPAVVEKPTNEPILLVSMRSVDARVSAPRCVLRTAARARFLCRRGHGAPSPRLLGAGDYILDAFSWCAPPPGSNSVLTLD